MSELTHGLDGSKGRGINFSPNFTWPDKKYRCLKNIKKYNLKKRKSKEKFKMRKNESQRMNLKKGRKTMWSPEPTRTHPLQSCPRSSVSCSPGFSYTPPSGPQPSWRQVGLSENSEVISLSAVLGPKIDCNFLLHCPLSTVLKRFPCNLDPRSL